MFPFKQLLRGFHVPEFLGPTTIGLASVKTKHRNNNTLYYKDFSDCISIVVGLAGSLPKLAE